MVPISERRDRMKARISWALFLLFAFTGAVAAVEDWSRFRGPNGSGVSETTGLPVEFGPDSNVVWKTDLPFSASSPVVAGDTVFVTSYADGSLLTYSIDRTNGHVRWKRSIERGRAGEIYSGNDPASPSPVTDGDNVYAFFPDLGLVSYDSEGNERWRSPLGPFHTFYGMSTSPIVHGHTLLLLCDQQSGSFLVALDTDDGGVRWKVERVGRMDSWTTPIVHAPEGESALVVTVSSMFVDAYSVDSGEHEWWLRGVGYAPVSGPVIHDGTLYVNAPDQTEFAIPAFPAQREGYDKDGDGRLSREEVKADELLRDHFGWLDPNSNDYIEEKEYQAAWEAAETQDFGVIAVRLGGSGDVTNSHIAWRYKKSIPYAPTHVLYDNVLYLVRNGGIVTALDPSTGELHKRGRARGALESYYASPVAADGKVFLTSEAGKVTVLKAGTEWEILALNDLGEDVVATPILADGKIYLRTRERLYCFGHDSSRK